MGYPNNVRKVMNVQIGTRFYNSQRVSTINNDSVLEWWKDEVSYCAHDHAFRVSFVQLQRNLISRYAAITISFHSNGKISKMNALVVADIGVNESVSQISFSSHLIEGRIVVGKVGS